MLIIPAIDLKDQECVRLKQGLMEEATVFSSKPAEMAQHWASQGAQRLHLVDLNGAFAGEPQNLAVIREIVQTCPQLTLQLGGGIRSLKTLNLYFELGIHYAIIGTQAILTPEFVDQACQTFPGKIIVGLDAKEGQIAINGWSQVTNQSAAHFTQRFANSGVSAIIYTDIGRDGMLQGLNIEATAQLARNSRIPIIASGGLHNMTDIHALCEIAQSETVKQAAGIQGVIAGRALYENSLNLQEAQAYANAC